MKMRKIVAILAAVLMLLSVMPIAAFAADENVADFNSISNTSTSYTTVTTTNGWKMAYCAVFSGGSSNSSPKFSFIDSSETTKAVCMNGKTSAVGSITSPTLSGGISKLTFSYGLPFSDSKISATVTITGADGTSVSTVVENLSASKNTKYDFEWVLDTPIEGDFTIVIKNNSPSNSTSNKDRTAVWNLAWESASSSSADCDHDSLVCGDTCPECGTYVKEHVFANNCAATCSNCDEANPNYADHVYSGDYDASCNVCGTTREVTLPTDPAEIVDLAYSMVQGDAFPAAVTLTGVISAIDEAYNESYGNITVTIDVIDADGNLIEGKAIQCYRMKGEGAASIIVGDTITVSGILKNYYDKIEFDSGCTLDSYEKTGCAHEYVGVETTPASCTVAGVMTYTCSACGDSYTEDIPVADHTYVDGFCSVCGAEKINLVEYTITFDDAKTQRTEFSTSAQVWTEGDLVFTNNKASSSSSVADYGNPVRLYKSSEVIIACPGMTSIVIDASSVGGTKYATPWADTLTAAGLTFTATTDNIYTVTLAEPVDSITLTCSAQIRALSITVTAAAQGDAADCEHSWNAATCTEPATCALCGATDGEALGHNYVEDIIDATCTATGSATYECSVCFDSYDETIPMKPHNYVDGICSACGAELPLEATITFDDAKTQRTEYSTETQKWEHDGLVFINNKASSTNNVGDYSNPGRFYKSSEIIISFPGMTSLVIDATGVDADKLWDDTLTNAGLTFTVEEKIYTITFAEPTDSITLTAANQVRANSITATGVKEEPACEHEYTYACDQICCKCYELTNPDAAHTIVAVEAVEATCSENGNIAYWYCSDCGSAWADEALTQVTNQMSVIVPATGEHTYDDEYDADCNVCGDVREVPEKPVETVYGDANGDGEINLRDVALLQQYTSNWEVTLDLAASDANGDGEVNLRDVALLQQYTSNWDVTLGPVETPDTDDNNGFNDGVLEW